MKKPGPFYVFALISVGILLLVLPCCQMPDSSAESPDIPRDTAISAENAYSGLFFDSLAMEEYLDKIAVADTAKKLFREFYNQRNFQFAWFDTSGVAEQARSFWNLQENFLAYQGDSSIYNPFLQRWSDSVAVYGLKAIPDSTRPHVEWEMTFQFFRYAAKAYLGNKNLDASALKWYIPRKRIDILSLLDTLVIDKGMDIRRYEPVNRQYTLLREQLKRYYSMKQNGSWDTLITRKSRLKEGDADSVLLKLKHRLSMGGDLERNDSTILFTKEVTAAVKNFQQRYGLKEDGVIGGTTLTELSRPITYRIRQILVNMERLRWVPSEPTSDYLLVNIPEYRLHVYEGGKYAYNMNVVVGTSTNSTVIFTGKLRNVVFSPYWNVPPDILKNEVLPGIKRDPAYLARHNMEWNGGRVRQKPGPKNSLGLVKFLFPNSYNIYLHDTPSKSLFSENKRAFSHGCIRVSEPEKLAAWVLRSDSSWNTNRISLAMHSGKEQYVVVKKDLPVFIGYFTTWVDRDGKLNFREDIYGHDQRMSEKMFGTERSQ
ncbi:L,D-transpeptidase family protein [Flavihumibacter solisilvae]|uniref:ErfK/YbiS/YcfS/YnhG family protein n=1 Tax=Flavihumibacter solisilvae TaxID=1349421 RepID=A0A0C1IQP7_9BACT|nr:L,D-transpeptidase family protein [Flavihumibacter solisilvae]KIC92804.1 ErfK/YbiS/YcfS/YnhG family protein [Flavihumibacter solisilvae]